MIRRQLAIALAVFSIGYALEKDMQKSLLEKYISSSIEYVLGAPDPTVKFYPDYHEAGQLIKDMPIRGGALIFENIPRKSSYQVKQRRFLQKDSLVFSKSTELTDVLNVIQGKGNLQIPFGIFLPSDDFFLCGELVSYQITSSDGEILKEGHCVPKQLMVKNSKGEKLAEAVIISLFNPTVYMIVFPKRHDTIECTCIVDNKQQKWVVEADKVEATTIEPARSGKTNAAATLRIESKNEVYYLRLPPQSEIVKRLESESNHMTDTSVH
jgi:signal recognition particle subunit SEC65